MKHLTRSCLAFVWTLACWGATLAYQEGPPVGPKAREAAARVEPDRIVKSVRHLASYPSRHSASEGCDDAARWLAGQFRGLGYDDVRSQEFDLKGRPCRNVIADKPGAEPDRLVIVGAHYDSRGRDLNDPDAPAPGADDNASGTAGLLELARVLKDVPTRWSIRFVAFAGEEQGLVGSRAYAKAARAEGQKIELMMNMDMIGHPFLKEGGRKIVLVERDKGHRRKENDAASQRFAARMTKFAAAFPALDVRDGPLYGTDYMPFEAEGYACLGVFDGADKAPFYHSDEDTPDVIDADYAAEVVKLVAATLVEIAGTP